MVNGKLDNMKCSRKECDGKAVISFPLKFDLIGYACQYHIMDQMNARYLQLNGVYDKKKVAKNINARNTGH